MLGDIFLHQIVGMLEDQDLVTHDHSHQRDESEDGGQTQGTIHHAEAYQRTRDHQGEGHHTDEGDAVLLEVEEQEEEDDDHGYRDAADNLGHGLVAIFDLASHLAAHTIGDGYLVLHDVGNAILHRRGEHSLGEMGCHRDAALTATVHDAALAPLGLHLRYLAQGHGGIGLADTSGEHRQRRADAQILDVGIAHIGIVAHNDRQIIVALPYLTYAEVAGRGTQREGCRGAGEAHLCRGDRVELDADEREGLQIIGMHPLELGHLAHALHQPLGYHMEGVEILAIEAVFELGHLQVVETLELDVCLRELLTDAWLVVRQQGKRGLVALGVDNHLCVVAACYLRGIGIHESRR